MSSLLGNGIACFVGRRGVRGVFNIMERGNYSTTTNGPSTYETLAVHVPKPFVYHVELNRPKKSNSFSSQLWQDLETCFDELSASPDCRVVVLNGIGKNFAAGIDFQDLVILGQNVAKADEIARKSKIIRNWLKSFQDSTSSLERCAKPVIAVGHNACVGAGLDLFTTADIRYCSSDAWFQVKEVDLGLAADMGTLQRLPKIVGNESLVRELCFTARKFDSKEAFQMGLVSKVFQDKDSAVAGALKLAEEIAGKSPVGVQNTKKSIIYSRDHAVQDGLDQIILINETGLQSEDFINACMAEATKGDKPVYAKL